MTTITSIPLSQLVASKANVRKTGGTSIEDLAANISAVGLIQNLTVRQTTKGKRTVHEVIAGGRRFAALQRLAKDGGNILGVPVAADLAIPCRVLADGEDATEISLAENAIRQAMHPADQFDAFKALADGGMGIGDIAARFGLDEKIVRQRLRLAALSPKVLAAFRKDEIGIEQAMAFIVSEDHARQDAVLKAAKADKYGYARTANGIREALVDQAVRASDGDARFIGEDAYVAAGGTVTRDLFSEKDEAYFDDGALVDRLVAEKLEAVAEQVRGEGWGEVRVNSEGWFSAYREGLIEPNIDGRVLTAEEEAEIARLEDVAEALSDDRENDAEHRRLRDEAGSIRRRAADDWSAVAGKDDMIAVVTLDRHSAQAKVHRGLTVRPKDATQGGLPMLSTPAVPKAKPEFSAFLLERLTAERTLAMRAAMLDQPDTALTTVVWTLAAQHFCDATDRDRVAKIAISSRDHMTPGSEMKAGRAMEAAVTRWLNELPDKPAALFDSIFAMNLDKKLELLTYLVATSLDAVQRGNASVNPSSHVTHAALGLDMADWWEPTADSYLSHVSKDKTVEALREAGIDEERIADVARAKKDEHIARAEKLLAGTRWLPSPLRLPVVANDDAAKEGEAA